MNILIFDCHYLCHRAFHVFGGKLSHGGSPTGVIYGVLQSISSMIQQHRAHRVVYCWDDSPNSIRQKRLPQYKANRQVKLTEEEKNQRAEFYRQIDHLRDVILPSIGFQNILWQKGYEADDHIAAACIVGRAMGGKMTVVSSDHDLYQLIRHDIQMYNPHTHKILTHQGFQQEYHIEPSAWPVVKALAGCSGDNVPGLKGIGEKTAVRYLRGELNPETKTYRKIKLAIADKHSVYWRNLPLVKLPLKGTHRPKIKPHHISRAGVRDVRKRLGITRLSFM